MWSEMGKQNVQGKEVNYATLAAVWQASTPIITSLHTADQINAVDSENIRGRLEGSVWCFGLFE